MKAGVTLTPDLKYCARCIRRVKPQETPVKKDKTDIVIVLDRSGSMSSCQIEAQAGLNNFIAEQKAVPGLATLTLIQFDDRYEVVHESKPIGEVEPFTLVPRGGTALHYAIGRAIDDTGKRLAAMAEDARPGLVLFAVLTDGEENASHNMTPYYTKAQVAQMVKHQAEKYSWKFSFLAAGQDAVLTGTSLNFPAAASATFTGARSANAYGALSAVTTSARVATAKGQSASIAYSDTQRLSMV
jgi:uncharacterized protein YegL